MNQNIKDLINNQNQEVKEMCKCGKNHATEPHTCPYNEDVHNDCETLCNCCDECAYECAMDI